MASLNVSAWQQQLSAHVEEVKKFVEAQLANAQTWSQEMHVKANLWLEQQNMWDTALNVGAFMNDNPVPEPIKQACVAAIDKIREHQGAKARKSTVTTTVVFGTSGWRGVIGEDFTVLNVHKTVRGIIDMMKTDDFLRYNKMSSFADVQKAGLLILRDNRYMGDEFMDAAMKECAAEGIKLYFAGECPTGVGSALVPFFKLAGSLNFTPSHNPMDYAGLKFNPADGGPAPPEITNIIQDKANAYMKPDVEFTAAETDYSALKTDIDAKVEFVKFLEQNSRVFSLAKIREWLQSNKQNLFILIDNMHGASRGYLEKIIGDDLTAELKEAGSLEFVNTDTDYSFHGVKPEPSAKNQAPLIERLKAAKESGRHFTLCAALDPDADRARFGDADMDMDMNRFGPVAYACILDHVMKGGIASTAPSSDFALEIAKQNHQKVFELAVGFKEFRECLLAQEVVLAFEESDGISFVSHTLDKCAMAGVMMAINTIVLTGKNISEQYKELQAKYGYFYPDKAGADVKGLSVEQWQSYKGELMNTLQNKLYKVGDTVDIGGQPKTITAINTIDGLKVIFGDRSWILLRASGTEPKFRYYYEVVSETPLPNDGAEVLNQYKEAASGILTAARAMVDNK